VLGMVERMFLAYPASQPSGAPRLALDVAPHVVANVNTFVLLDPLGTDVAIILLQFLEKGFLKVRIPPSCDHADKYYWMGQGIARDNWGIHPGSSHSASASGRTEMICSYSRSTFLVKRVAGVFPGDVVALDLAGPTLYAWRAVSRSSNFSTSHAR
jgi:hypothetical protein